MLAMISEMAGEATPEFSADKRTPSRDTSAG
jgi:hypothetical protein